MNKIVVASFSLALSWSVQSSEVEIYYKNFSLTDTETNEVAQGINTVGVEGNLFEMFYFEYEAPQGEESSNLYEYVNRVSELEDYNEKITAGLKPLAYLDSEMLSNLYVEYSKDVYQLQHESYTKYYLQEQLFLGRFSTSKSTGIGVSYGVFLHNNKREIISNSNDYSSEEVKDAYGLMVQYKSIFIPYQNGSPSGFGRYGTGILIDDIKVQYQFAGGEDYFFSAGIGLAHKSKGLNWHIKATLEGTTDTAVVKSIAGISYSF